MRNWLILADDLTGAADCAVAFARCCHAAEVRWMSCCDAQEIDRGPTILAIDTGSRGMTPAVAASRHAALVDRLPRGTALFKKIDSTLRGQPIAELVAILRSLRSSALAIIAPAFPATGRTTEAGCVRLHGAPLEDSLLWQRDHSYPSADLPALLAEAGLPGAILPLPILRAGGGPQAVRDALAAGHQTLVCDATTAGDLALIAQATLPFIDQLIWVGSGGLAEALAAAQPPGTLITLPPRQRGGGVLMVVGSLAEASRQAAARLIAETGIRAFAISPAMLRDPAARPALSAAIAAAIEAGEDVLATIEADDTADLAQGPALAAALGTLLQPAARAMGGLFATGGETARAVLDRVGVHGLRLLHDIEPGMPIALSRGAIEIPVVTKAGGFGHPGTMIGAHRHLHALLHGKERRP